MAHYLSHKEKCLVVHRKVPNSVGGSSSFHATLCRSMNKAAHFSGCSDCRTWSEKSACTSFKVRVWPQDNDMSWNLPLLPVLIACFYKPIHEKLLDLFYMHHPKAVGRRSVFFLVHNNRLRSMMFYAPNCTNQKF